MLTEYTVFLRALMGGLARRSEGHWESSDLVGACQDFEIGRERSGAILTTYAYQWLTYDWLGMLGGFQGY
jgi:hypothetical protein